MSAATSPVTIQTQRPGVPFSRLVTVELRKMFDTRSGFWLVATSLIISVLAAVAVIAFVPDSELSFGIFGAAFGTPLSLFLPIIAALAVTSEWSQRSGLVTFTLAPHRGAVIGAKAASSIIVAVVAILFAFVVGALGNVVGAAINGISPVWNLDVLDVVYLFIGNIFGVLIGFMFGVLLRNSAAAVVAYLVYSFVLPAILSLLAALQEWFADIQPWIDFSNAQIPLFNGDTLSGEQWAQLGTSSLIWFWIPLAVGVWSVLRAEVK
ncbi:MAG: ABC transporter permease subunit [Aeromicrobium sp.]|uniref:ABC transporter permease subunit n=1 Tax=Aeromicrobium sp. TaxID=1871063 RepID=UPI0025BCD2A3|nr:ABC transporter permease subunit [Aeromicrobium sp.]MCK5890759.1 ABC transporter permease [Aeromicrobium sp.]MDF1703273.1 ABC transporter permease subunit [Aeromicrobium sp.]